MWWMGEGGITGWVRVLCGMVGCGMFALWWGRVNKGLRAGGGGASSESLEGGGELGNGLS